MRKKWMVLLCLLFVGSGGVTLWIWSAQRSERVPSLLLPDSNRVHLIAVTVGTNAKINFGKPIERVLARLPGKLGSRFKINEVSATSPISPGSAIVLWFRYDLPAPPNTYLRASLVQEDDRLLAPAFSSHPRTLSNGLNVAHCGTHLWPRRNRTLTFRVEQALSQSHESVQIGELTIANPAYRSYPVWSPENLPGTRSLNGVDFKLERPIARRQAQVIVTSGGKPDPTWEVWGYWLRDATGNLVTDSELQHGAPARKPTDSMGIVTLSPMCYGMPKEPAWKLGMLFVRARAWAWNEVVLLRGVPATPTGPRFSGTWRTNLPIGIVQLRCQPDWENGSRNLCLVPHQAEVADLANGVRNPLAIIILGAVNDAGRKVEHVDARKIYIPPGSTTLDITIAIPRQHFIEFTIDPKSFMEPLSTPAYLRFPDSVNPENIFETSESNEVGFTSLRSNPK